MVTRILVAVFVALASGCEWPSDPPSQAREVSAKAPAAATSPPPRPITSGAAHPLAAAGLAPSRARDDVNGDGRSDLLLRNPELRQTAFWIMQGSTPLSFSAAFDEPTNGFRVPSIDLDADGRLDMAWQEGVASIFARTLYIWMGDGVAFTKTQASKYVPAGWLVVDAGDIDGDGKGDFVLHHAATRSTSFWIMDGPTVVRQSGTFAEPEGYVRVASGDFNADARLDLVWARKSDGSVLMWLGDGVGFNQVPVRDHAPGWAVTAAGDIDGDGKSDLLLTNAALELTAYWIMDGSIPLRYSPLFQQPAGFLRVATGDYDGNGKLDLVWARESDRALLMWHGDGHGFSQTPMRDYSPGWEVIGTRAPLRSGDRRYTRGDIDGDGRSDVLLENAGFDVFAYWIMDGPAPLRYSGAFARPAGYARVATGDFNGDAKLDIVWARSSDRAMLLWQGDGNGFTALSLPAYPPNWKVVGAGDVNGDAKTDLLLSQEISVDPQFGYWIMDGATVVRSSPTIYAPQNFSRNNTTFQTVRYPQPLVATGDFTGEGKLDLVWGWNAQSGSTTSGQDTTERLLHMWQGDGWYFADLPVRNHAAGWLVTGAGDIDGDGLSDLLLANATAGLTAYWVMQGATPIRYSLPFQQPQGYAQVATGDYNGDGKLDLLWVRSSDRNVLMWNGDGIGFTALPVGTHSAGWMIVQP